MAAPPPPDHSLDAETKAPEIISILSVCCAITTVLVTLRVITRSWIINAFGPDDWVIVVAQVLGIGAAVAIGLEHHFGMGRHVWTTPDLVPYTKTFYASILVYNASLVLVKISIVLMYRRIFVGKGMKRASLVILVFLVMWGIAVVSFLAMICLPIQALWDPTVQGRCMPFVPAFFAPACINMVTDFTIFLLPLPALRKLQLPTKQKIILSFILCLGLFTCVISIVRLSTLDAAATSSDTTWDNTGAALWSYLELTTTVMAACLPTLRPFVSRYFPHLWHHSSDSNHPKNINSSAHPPTWGSSSRGRATPVQGDSTDALYADAQYGLRDLPSALPNPTQNMDDYKMAAAERGQNHTVISSASAHPHR